MSSTSRKKPSYSVSTIDDHPLLASIVEVSLTVLFTFLPILFLSIPFTKESGTMNSLTFLTRFWNHWANGELTLPILTMCGAIASLAVVKSRAINGPLTYLAWVVAVAMAVGGGFALSASNGFSTQLYPEIVWTGFGLYALMLFLWATLSFCSRREPDRSNPEERAIDLLAKKKLLEGSNR